MRQIGDFYDSAKYATLMAVVHSPEIGVSLRAHIQAFDSSSWLAH